jgi:AAA+ superfamily predicted ATPase
VAPDPSVLAALETVVEVDPGNDAVRAHLAALLVDAGEPAKALAHLEVVLSRRPDHLEALDLAANAASLVGDQERASAWQRLHDALAGQPSASASEPAPSPSPAVAPVTRAPSPPLVPPAAPKAPDEPFVPADGEGLAESTDWDAELNDLLGQVQGDRVMLADVGGLEDVKHRLETSFLAPLRNPELRKMYGASLRGGLLLWGPPGCGKTFLARAIAGELGAHFASIGLHDVLDMWLGNSEKKLHEVFELARRKAPSVLFFDEVDAIGQARPNLVRSAARNVVAQLLTELDGTTYSNEGVFVVGATNQPWDVDSALRRPGRFDRSILVLPPEGKAREAILKHHLRDRPVAIESFSEVAKVTEGFSGADLRLACEEAAQRALADAVRTGVPGPIGMAELLGAARSLRPSTGAWFEMARNFATFANQTGEYDELVLYMRRNRLV